MTCRFDLLAWRGSWGPQVLAFNSVMTARQLAEFSVSDADEEMGRLIRDIEVLVAEQQRLAAR